MLNRKTTLGDRSLSRSAIVMTNQSTKESLVANAIGFRLFRRRIVARSGGQRAITEALVKSVPVEESNVFTEDAAQVLAAEADKVI